MLVWSWSQQASTHIVKPGYSGRPQGSEVLVRMELFLFGAGRKKRIIHILRLSKATTPQWVLGNVSDVAALRLQCCFDQVTDWQVSQTCNSKFYTVSQPKP